MMPPLGAFERAMNETRPSRGTEAVNSSVAGVASASIAEYTRPSLKASTISAAAADESRGSGCLKSTRMVNVRIDAS